MVKANLKSLSLNLGARVDEKSYQALYLDREKGSGAKIPVAFDQYFSDEKNGQNSAIFNAIQNWNTNLILDLESKIDEQSERLANAEAKLKLKETKAALNDQRVAGDKILKFKERLQALRHPDFEEKLRIFPHSYASLLVSEGGKRVLKPFRYHLRPKGESEAFDRKFDGTYNIRRDRLQDGYWWKNIYGKNHGVLVITKFYENVKKHDFEARKLLSGEREVNQVVEFSPRDAGTLLVPCLFDRNEEGAYPLDSFALITDEPNPEVRAAGHDRTPLFLKAANLDPWLNTEGALLSRFDEILRDKEETYFNARIQKF